MYGVYLHSVHRTSWQDACQGVRCHTRMPYPAKTNRAAILNAAVRQVEREGLASLSLRSLAGSLELAPNAIYRYFADRAHLEMAIANESALRLHAALVRATARGDAEQKVRRMAKAYLDFARDRPALYSALLVPGDTPGGQPSAHGQMWGFVVGLMSRLTDTAQAPEAAVALWAFLHGMVTLDQAGVFGAQKPRSAFSYGLDAFLAGLPRRPT